MKRFAFNTRAVLAFGHDLGMVLVSWAVALSLFGTIPGSGFEGWDRLALVLAFALPVQAFVATLAGMYQGLWRYASLPDVQRIVVSVVLGTASVASLMWIAGKIPPPGFPEFFVQSLMLICLMAGSRIGYRTWQERKLYGETSDQGIPVLVLGAGDAAVTLLKELSRSAEWRVMGLLDDDPNKRHRLLHGRRVIGAIEELPRVARSLKVKHAIIAMPSANYAIRRHIIEVCNRARVVVLTVPKFNGISMARNVPGKAVPPKIRRVSFEDLMKRELIVLDDAGLHDQLTGKVIMVTGAGGSIGSELCRQIAAYQPSMLVLFEQSEFADRKSVV